MTTHYRKTTICLLLAGVALAACEADKSTVSAQSNRWYTAEQAEHGRSLFQAHCANCHGDRAQGLAEDWRKTDADGNYPAPPLNGSAHAWHHPMVVLEATIMEGGVPLGGVMPGFASTLSENEVRAVIAHFQSLWADDIYARWYEINER